MKKTQLDNVGYKKVCPLLYTHIIKTGKMTLQQLVDKMTVIPANVFDLPYGVLEEGRVADLTLIDLEKTITIDKQSFVSKGKNTPFDGWTVEGVPVLTIAAGKIVYEDDINA